MGRRLERHEVHVRMDVEVRLAAAAIGLVADLLVQLRGEAEHLNDGLRVRRRALERRPDVRSCRRAPISFVDDRKKPRRARAIATSSPSSSST